MRLPEISFRKPHIHRFDSCHIALLSWAQKNKVMISQRQRREQRMFTSLCASAWKYLLDFYKKYGIKLLKERHVGF